MASPRPCRRTTVAGELPGDSERRVVGGHEERQLELSAPRSSASVACEDLARPLPRRPRPAPDRRRSGFCRGPWSSRAARPWLRACRAEMNRSLDHPTGGCGLIRGGHSLGGMADTVSTPQQVFPTAPKARRPGLRREIGLIGLLWASVGSIIGSGWLFGAQKALVTAGPAAIISWVIGGGGDPDPRAGPRRARRDVSRRPAGPRGSRTTPSAARRARRSAGSPGCRRPRSRRSRCRR